MVRLRVIATKVKRLEAEVEVVGGAARLVAVVHLVSVLLTAIVSAVRRIAKRQAGNAMLLVQV